MISLALKHHLSDKSPVYKQVNRPTAVYDALTKLKEINPFYIDVVIDNQWQDVNKESDALWDLLTNENTIENDASI